MRRFLPALRAPSSLSVVRTHLLPFAPSVRPHHPQILLADRHPLRLFTTTVSRSQHPTAVAAMNAGSPTSRSKRKASSPVEDRPLKQLRHAPNGKNSPGDNTPDVEHTGFMSKSEQEEDVPVFYQAQSADTAEWQATIENVVNSVVSIRFCQTYSFDTDSACASEATGFVVDAERG